MKMVDMNLFSYTYHLVKQIPNGKVSTYGAIAEALGDKRAARAVGYMMKNNPNPDRVPCYKIIYSDGKIGNYSCGGIKEKRKKLREDGIKLDNSKRVDLEKYLFKDFKTSYPLKKLREEQIELRKKVKIRSFFDELKKIIGIDVGYQKNPFKKAVVCCVVINYNSGEIAEKNFLFKKSLFPYIPTYLSYREYPLIKDVIKNIDCSNSVFMIDGNGILHPFSLGLASHVGVKMDIPTIGIAKSLLWGNIKKDYVFYEGKKIGYRHFTSATLKNPVYVSVGHKVNLDQSIKITKKFSKFRIPEPVRQAHISAQKKVKSLESS
ncbi:MAG: endonuclease V [Candidatus Thermoplasmatota archaeon]